MLQEFKFWNSLFHSHTTSLGFYTLSYKRYRFFAFCSLFWQIFHFLEANRSFKSTVKTILPNINHTYQNSFFNNPSSPFSNPIPFSSCGTALQKRVGLQNIRQDIKPPSDKPKIKHPRHGRWRRKRETSFGVRGVKKRVVVKGAPKGTKTQSCQGPTSHAREL